MPFKGNRRKRKNAKKNMKWSRPKTQQMYRMDMPRSIQVASHRPKNALVRFQYNNTAYINQPIIGGVLETVAFALKCNSITQVFDNTNFGAVGAITWQKPVSLTTTVDDFGDYGDRYEKYHVLSSKLTVQYMPNKEEPTAGVNTQPVLYINKYNELTSNPIGNSTTAIQLDSDPHSRRVDIGQNSQYGGGRLYDIYSARKFEGVSKVIDNQQLGSHTTAGASPSEQSHWGVALAPVLSVYPSGVHPTAGTAGYLKIRVEYNVFMSEPNPVRYTNPVAANLLGAHGGVD